MLLLQTLRRRGEAVLLEKPACTAQDAVTMLAQSDPQAQRISSCCMPYRGHVRCQTCGRLDRQPRNEVLGLSCYKLAARSRGKLSMSGNE